MLKHFTNRNGMTRLAERNVVVVSLSNNHLSTKLRQIFFYRVIEHNYPFVNQHQNRDRSHSFGLRSDSENGIGRHRYLSIDVGESDGFYRQHFVSVGNERHGTGEFMFRNKTLEYGRGRLGCFSVDNARKQHRDHNGSLYCQVDLSHGKDSVAQALWL